MAQHRIVTAVARQARACAGVENNAQSLREGVPGVVACGGARDASEGRADFRASASFEPAFVERVQGVAFPGWGFETTDACRTTCGEPHDPDQGALCVLKLVGKNARRGAREGRDPQGFAQDETGQASRCVSNLDG